MSRSPHSHNGLDVAVVIDATMKPEHLSSARELVSTIPRSARVAMIAFGDHPECAGNADVPGDLFDVVVAPFSTDQPARAAFFDSGFAPVTLAYCDASLECALLEAADLDWRDEAAKRLIILGWSMPHHSSIAKLPIRTGVECPRKQCWKTQLERVTRLPFMQVLAAMPKSDSGAIGFMERLRSTVWRQLNRNTPPTVLDGNLGASWKRHWPE